MRSTCRTRLLVVECKNLSTEPGQREVESLQQYLYGKAMRNLGLLVARRRPSRSAELARRRAWLEADELILFSADDDLAEMIVARDRGEEPEELFEAQLHAFFADLVA